MSASAQPGALPRGGAYGPGAMPPGNGFGPGWGAPPGGSAWSPWSFVWAVPKPFLIAGMVLAFILFWPIGLAVLFFLIGSGRLGGRWARRAGRDGMAVAPGGGAACGWGGWRREEAAAMSSSGNQAFDEYRMDTLRRLEDEQREFAAFLDRLRFAKDKSEFDQFMTERRRPRPEAPSAPAPEAPPQG